MKHLFQIILILLAHFLVAQNHWEINSCQFSIATNGLNLRNAPSIHADILSKIGFGHELEILSLPKSFENRDWVKVKFQGMTGYVVAEWISKIPLIQYSGPCFPSEVILSYFRNTMGLLDNAGERVEESQNNSGDESFQVSRTHRWQNGIVHVRKIFYEDFVDEIHIPKRLFSRVQIVDIIKSSFKSCGKLTNKNLVEMHKLTDRSQIDYIESFSSIQLITRRDQNILRLKY